MNPSSLPGRVRRYLAGVIDELRKTRWPSRRELTSSALVTLTFTVIAVLAFTLIDAGLGSLFGVIFA